MGLQLKCQLIHKDLLQALHRLFANQGSARFAGFDAAHAPFALHALDAPSADLDAKDWLPFFQKLGDEF